jgi:hypothetical protein
MAAAMQTTGVSPLQHHPTTTQGLDDDVSRDLLRRLNEMPSPASAARRAIDEYRGFGFWGGGGGGGAVAAGGSGGGLAPSTAGLLSPSSFSLAPGNGRPISSGMDHAARSTVTATPRDGEASTHASAAAADDDDGSTIVDVLMRSMNMGSRTHRPLAMNPAIATGAELGTPSGALSPYLSGGGGGGGNANNTSQWAEEYASRMQRERQQQRQHGSPFPQYAPSPVPAARRVVANPAPPDDTPALMRFMRASEPQDPAFVFRRADAHGGDPLSLGGMASTSTAAAAATAAAPTPGRPQGLVGGAASSSASLSGGAPRTVDAYRAGLEF